MDETAELGRQFARTLRHLGHTWDVAYVPAGPTPGAPEGSGRPTAMTTGTGTATAKVDAKQALRSQAQAWGPAMKLEYLHRKNVGDCARCPLSRTRTHIVFGVGSPQARIMFVGEAPGADEDRQGEPFVGAAGRRLTQWIETLGFAREDVYIANVLKCRPPGNRDPIPEEIDRCSPFLRAQIRAIAPAVIVALGRHAGQLLSRTDATLRSMRTSRLTYDAGKSAEGTSLVIPLQVTYHPAWVLRQQGPARGQDPDEMVLADLKKAVAIAYPGRAG